MTDDEIVAEDYLNIRRVMDIQSSDTHVAWVENKPNPVDRGYESFIKLLNKKSGEIMQFTAGTKRDFHPRFSPDGSNLAFLSTRGEKPQIHLMRIDGGEATALTSEEQGVTAFTWRDDGKQIAYISSVDPNKGKEEKEPPLNKFEAEKRKLEKEEKEREVTDPRIITTLTYRRGTSYDHPDRYAHVFIYDLEEEESRRISDGYFHHSAPRYTEEGKIVVVSNREQPRDLSTTLSVVKFDPTTTSLGEVETTFEAGWPVAPEMDYGLTLVNTYEEGNYAGQNSKWAIIDGDESKIINKELDRGLGQLRILSSTEILAGVDSEGKTHIHLYNVDKDNFNKLFDAEASVVDFTGNKEEIYFTATHPLHVWAVWKWSAEDGVELLDDPNMEAFENKAIIEPEEMWFTNPEGIKYHGWFFPAPGDDKPPLVLSIHGGPHAMWNNAGTMWHEWQVTLHRGYSVLALNPIGSQGYGEDYSQIITSKWGVNDARDLLSAVDEISDRIDKDRLYITGGSYAGFQTANVISRDKRFKAAVAQRGVYDLITFGLTTDIPLWATWEWEGTPWDRLEHLWEHSPVGRAQDIETPLMIMHAENDFRVAISQAEELFAALKLQDKEAVLVRYPRDGHELSRSGEPLHVIDRIERMIDWFESYP